MTHLLQAAVTTVIIGTDTRGLITVFNSGAQHLLGHHPHDMVGRPLTDLLDPDELRGRTGTDEPAAAFKAVTEGIGSGTTRARDWTWVSRTGERHTIATTLSVAADSFAAQVGFLCLGRDVTEQRQSQELLVAALDKERTAVDRLRQLDEAKNEFVSTVSHELRTPVTSIVGYTEMLADGSVVEPDAAQVPLLATIARNGQRLVLICNDLLLLSGLDSGAAVWERETVELAALFDHVEQALRPLLVGRDLKLDMRPGDEPLEVLGDRAQLERVLLNLLSNAVKFTEDGGSIRAAWCATAPRPAWWCRTTASASPRRSSPGCSSASSGPRARSPGPSRAPGSGCPSSPRSSRPTVGGSRSTPPTCRARRSRCGCPAARRGRQARLTAEITAFSDAVTMFGSSPTPQSTLLARPCTRRRPRRSRRRPTTGRARRSRGPARRRCRRPGGAAR